MDRKEVRAILLTAGTVVLGALTLSALGTMLLVSTVRSMYPPGSALPDVDERLVRAWTVSDGVVGLEIEIATPDSRASNAARFVYFSMNRESFGYPVEAFTRSGLASISACRPLSSPAFARVETVNGVSTSVYSFQVTLVIVANERAERVQFARGYKTRVVGGNHGQGWYRLHPVESEVAIAN